MNPSSPEFTLLRRIENYREAKQAMMEARELMFPVGCVVRVKRPCSGTMDLIGIVQLGDFDAAEVAVFLENGNVWSYPASQCSRMDNVTFWPKWIQRKLLSPSKANWVCQCCGMPIDFDSMGTAGLCVNCCKD